MVEVSWNDATAFCAWLSKKEGQTYELPTEAEWEYACRAGTKTRFWCGDADDSLKANANVADASLNEELPRRQTGPLPGTTAMRSRRRLASFKANPWGLYDMHGNVLQWCSDGFCRYQEGYIKDPNIKIRNYPCLARRFMAQRTPRLPVGQPRPQRSRVPRRRPAVFGWCCGFPPGLRNCLRPAHWFRAAL